MFDQPRPLLEILAEIETITAAQDTILQARKRLGASLQAVRVTSGSNQQDVAKALKVSQSYVSKVESGDITMSTDKARSLLAWLEGEEGSADGTDKRTSSE